MWDVLTQAEKRRECAVFICIFPNRGDCADCGKGLPGQQSMFPGASEVQAKASGRAIGPVLHWATRRSIAQPAASASEIPVA